MTTSTPSPHHFVVFTVEGQSYALPLSQVSRAVRMAALTPLPEAAPWVAGFANVAGRVAPVVDLRRRLGGDHNDLDPQKRLLILDVQGQDLGLIVDQVTEVLELHSARVESPPESLFPTHMRLLSGVLQQSESLILVLDPDRL
jgi:purine-binding chemotaxis protein CheW